MICKCDVNFLIYNICGWPNIMVAIVSSARVAQQIIGKLARVCGNLNDWFNTFDLAPHDQAVLCTVSRRFAVACFVV